MLAEMIIVHKDVIKRFQRLSANNRLAHAYLFIGPQLIGKSETALVLAKALNNGITWEDVQKEITPEFLAKIKTNDPDIHWVECAYGETIKIETVRGLLAKTRMRPYFSPRKIFIIQNIDQLTLEGANALLKTLEEPSADSLLFLTSASPERILPTIRSRCQALHFSSRSCMEVASELSSYYDVHRDESQFLAMFSEGCLGKAVNLKDQKFFESKNRYIDEFIFQPDSDDFVKKIILEKEKTKFFLDVLLSWVRDSLLIKAGINDTLINLDRINDLECFRNRFTLDELNDMYEDIVNARKLLAQNLNIKIPLNIIKERCYG